MRRVACTLACLLLSVAAARAVTSDLGTDEQRAEGRELYDKYCAQCHGIAGDGQGHATSRVKPAPRDFTSGKYKFRTTPSGMLPTDDDLRRVIRQGLPYTTMPGWPSFTDAQVQNLIFHLKTFSDTFQNPDKLAEPIVIPEPPPLTADSVERGREVFAAQGCTACHGQLGRGDGASAPTLTDDWGHHIRAADMSQRWTFRGGATRSDIYRTFSTGVNGTPMPSYADSLAEAERWDLVNYVYSLGESDTPNYANLLLVDYVEGQIDLADPSSAFEGARAARFPLVGQIMEPGRNFHPQATSVLVDAVYNRSEIAFRLRWSDLRGDTSGSNGPALEVPLAEESIPDAGAAGAAGGEEGDFWGEAATEAAPAAQEDFWGEQEAPAAAAGDDFWGEDEGRGAPAAAGAAGFADAVALQFPTVLPTGIAKPYFIFGDGTRSVDLWFVDLARGTRVEQYVGRGSASLTPAETDVIEVVSSYDQGQWTVLFKRPISSRSGLSFAAGQYAPVAFSVWDGFNRERGNKRALSQWMYLYVEPAEQVSATGPMIRVAAGVLLVELAAIFFLRWHFGRRREARAAMVPVAGR